MESRKWMDGCKRTVQSMDLFCGPLATDCHSSQARTRRLRGWTDICALSVTTLNFPTKEHSPAN